MAHYRQAVAWPVVALELVVPDLADSFDLSSTSLIMPSRPNTLQSASHYCRHLCRYLVVDSSSDCVFPPFPSRSSRQDSAASQGRVNWNSWSRNVATNQDTETHYHIRLERHASLVGALAIQGILARPVMQRRDQIQQLRVRGEAISLQHH